MSHLMNANLRMEAIESFESALASSVACRKTNHLSEREFHRTSAGTGSQEFLLLTSPGKLAGTKKPQGCAGPDQKWASRIFKIDSVLFFHFNCAGISSFIYHGIQKPKSQTPRKKRSFPKKVELLEISYFQDCANYTNIPSKEHPGWDIYGIFTRYNSLLCFTFTSSEVFHQLRPSNLK